MPTRIFRVGSGNARDYGKACQFLLRAIRLAITACLVKGIQSVCYNLMIATHPPPQITPRVDGP